MEVWLSDVVHFSSFLYKRLMFACLHFIYFELQQPIQNNSSVLIRLNNWLSAVQEGAEIKLICEYLCEFIKAFKILLATESVNNYRGKTYRDLRHLTLMNWF